MSETVRRGYSKSQVREMGFPTSAYQFPAGEGSFTGTLVMKKWNGKGALICYFDADIGAKYKLCVWFSRDVNRTYCPTKSSLNMSFVELGSSLRITYGQTKNGTCKWLEAELLEDPSYDRLQQDHCAMFGDFFADYPDFSDLSKAELKELKRRVALGEALAHKIYLEDPRVWRPTLTDEEREILAQWDREWKAQHTPNEDDKDGWRKFLTTAELNFIDGLTDDVYSAQAVEGVGGGPHEND